ncbi:hypothetical protein [Bdellovibrio reynosensis]|uniref:Uncharacterized protein n=1 Tax=Bdellovibrio reynosensis TaxID=2835041 RepID=A0ABY4CF13_9BACT|nr:hypothetical protein [Bdellovibrio reynosensis]UOF02477.1 hypothetical protein MNR06_05875 [Bdellovibrio reynosensis]
MQIRSVLLIVFGIVSLSVASSFITFKILQNSKEAIQTSNVEPMHLEPKLNTALQTSQTLIPPPPPAPKAEVAAQTNSTVKNMEIVDPSAFEMPAELDHKKDHRKPLSSKEAKEKLLKNAKACWDDYETLCRKTRFFSESPLACLRHKKDEISGACANQVASIQAEFKKDCESDIQKFCANQKRYFACLREQLPLLSASCRKNISESSR